MSLKIRLARGGAKKRPYYSIVVADARSPRDGRFIEKLGTYNPMLDRSHADRFGVVHEVHEIAKRTMSFVDAVVIRDVVSVVSVRGAVKRLEPDAGDAEPGEVVEAAHQPFEIADAVAVCVLIFLDVEAVDDGVLIPEVVDRHRGAVALCVA